MLHSYIYQQPLTKKAKRESEHKYTKGVVFFFIFAFLVITALIMRFKPTKELATQKTEVSAEIPEVRILPSPKSTIPTPKPAKSRDELIKSITEVVDMYGGTYSVRFEDLKAKDSFSINDEYVMDAASV